MAHAPDGRVPLLIDTNVYIRNAAGTLPQDAVASLDRALLYHCSVCLAELAAGVANGDPSHPNWPTVRAYDEEATRVILGSHILVPDAQIWLDAAVLSGTMARIQGFQPHQRKELLNDALILLTAVRAGLPVLTTNRNDFDLLQQLAPEGRFYHCWPEGRLRRGLERRDACLSRTCSWTLT